MDYNEIHHVCTGSLSAGFDEAAETGLRKMTFQSRLCLTVMSTELEKLGARGDKAAAIEKYYYRGQYHGVSYFYYHRKPEADLSIYNDSPTMACHLYRWSVKLAYLTYLVHKICIVYRRKVIVFCDWPATAWLVELLMLVHDINVLSIRARHKNQEREEVVAASNDPADPVQVLFTSYKVSSIAINLQEAYSDVVLFDVASNG